MATYRRRNPARSFLGWFLAIGLLLLLGLGGTALTLAATDNLDWRRWPLFAQQPERVIPEGWVAVPVSAGAIPAYTKVTRDHLFNGRAGKFAVVHLPPDQVPPRAILRMSGIMGRVLERDKRAGYAFTEDDFLPAGTREGLSAGVPPGMRAYRLEASKVSGVHGLNAGDRIDLIATIPLEFDTKAGNAYLLRPGAQPGVKPPKQVEVRVVVENGVLVTPVTARAEAVTSTTLMQGTRTTATPRQEIVLAVAPREVARLSEAEALGYQLTAVAHSGNPEVVEESPIVPVEHVEEIAPRVLETIVGSKRERLLFPNGGESPVKLE